METIGGAMAIGVTFKASKPGEYHPSINDGSKQK
jgi:hypothetical protein